ncbi:MAG: BON domain-containing protein [Gammaproteobacteria bacterium]|nr:BON domain-containing protein [Gammaproteobacteria bacterium]NIR84007.1 BON domain-containing protein [Gammaproteobacteria bacterium]NIR89151.1 BON domain-containing protein [Gammaproteobacteria bacterium]NIU04953.1 BON domain-containing protein [Gammaproteobacteria bacterium]NIV52119.1 BON domain-containing protein [Gammaproteobacteria bacterium]
MSDTHETLERVRASLMGEPRLDWHRYPLTMHLEGGVLTLEGEVRNIPSKRHALKRAQAVPGVREVVDRVRVAPAERMGDGAVLDHVRDALLQEPALGECTISVLSKGRVEPVHAPSEPAGNLRIAVDDAVVSLEGEVPSLSHRRLAEVLTWWVPGSRDVVNRLAVSPPEEDNDDEVTEAVRLALEKDPFVNASQIRVHTRNCVITLEGLVPTEGECDMAECDAWYVSGVEEVVNRIEARPGAGESAAQR